MPPASSPGLRDRHDSGDRASERAAKVRLRRAITLMVMTLLVPGSAQLVAGDRRVGRIAIRIWLGLIGALLVMGFVALVWHKFAFRMAFDLVALNTVRGVLMLVAIGWAALFVDAWRLGQPLTLVKNHRLLAVGVNGLLCFSVAGTLLFAAHLVSVQRDFAAMFANGKTSSAEDGRYNILLMGGDSGAGRWGLRPDSMTVASVDVETGRTVLIGLPRNLANFTFREGSVMAEQFPEGFNCDECYLNGVSTWAGDNPELFGKSANPGIDATIMAIEGITDLKINYWAMANLQGFKDLVDAVGGVTLTVRDRIPVGGLGSDVTGYIEPGYQKLDGYRALWYSRSRAESTDGDFSRMRRQRCMVGALLKQVNPTSMLVRYPALAKTLQNNVRVDIPQQDLDEWAILVLRIQDGGTIKSLPLTNKNIDVNSPNYVKIHKMVDEAINPPEPTTIPTQKSPGTSPSPKQKTPDPSSTTTGDELSDLDSIC